MLYNVVGAADVSQPTRNLIDLDAFRYLMFSQSDKQKNSQQTHSPTCNHFLDRNHNERNILSYEVFERTPEVGCNHNERNIRSYEVFEKTPKAKTELHETIAVMVQAVA